MLKRVLDPRTIIRVQTWDSEALAPSSVEEVLGVAWPQNTGAAANGRVDIIFVGPADWLVLAADPDATPWLHRLEALFLHSTFRATNVSQALIRIKIEGPEVRDLLAKGCALDLHPPRFPSGRSARTCFAGMPVIVRCTGTCDFELIVTQSYSEFLLSWLADAELEFEARK
jgi:sarcosine oxidase, subunit gamma